MIRIIKHDNCLQWENIKNCSVLKRTIIVSNYISTYVEIKYKWESSKLSHSMLPDTQSLVTAIKTTSPNTEGQKPTALRFISPLKNIIELIIGLASSQLDFEDSQHTR